MKQWWQQLQQREQQLVLAMAAVVLVFIGYQGIWQPINTSLEQAQQKLQRTESLLAYVNENTAKVAALGSGAKKPFVNGSLSSIVNRAAQQYQVTIDRIQPQQDAVQVWVDEVPFEQLLRWLDNLDRQYGLTATSVDISEHDTVGIVKVRRLILTRN
ncbi:type II secretion system protein GspM [Colwellia sp. MEBiC06753]